MYRTEKNNKSLSRQGSGPLSHLESSRAVPFLHKVPVVPVNLSVAATAQRPHILWGPAIRHGTVKKV